MQRSAPAAGAVPIMARRRTTSSGKLALLLATAATAPKMAVTCGGTLSCPVARRYAHLRPS